MTGDLVVKHPSNNFFTKDLCSTAAETQDHCWERKVMRQELTVQVAEVTVKVDMNVRCTNVIDLENFVLTCRCCEFFAQVHNTNI